MEILLQFGGAKRIISANRGSTPIALDERRLVFRTHVQFWGGAMSERAAVGNGPVAYFTDAGQRVLFPLSAIYFDGDDVKARTTTTDSLTKWLKYLVAQGRLAPSAAPPPVGALVLTAAAPGTAGNKVVVKVAPNNANPTQVDITTTETNTYTGVTLADLPTVLGSSGDPGEGPGLVRFKPSTDPGPPPDPAAMTAVPVPPETPPVAGALPSWEIKGPTPTSATTSFTLEARGEGSDTGTMTIKVTDVKGSAGAKTFTLHVEWTSTITIDKADDLSVSISELTSKPRLLAFAVRISEPAGGGGYKLPRPGTVALHGGADPADAIQAKATFPAADA
jgi:hypothetical protein